MSGFWAIRYAPWAKKSSAILMSQELPLAVYKMLVKLTPGAALVYFSGPWENILTLWQYLKFNYFKIEVQIAKKRLVKPNLT